MCTPTKLYSFSVQVQVCSERHALQASDSPPNATNCDVSTLY